MTRRLMLVALLLAALLATPPQADAKRSKLRLSGVTGVPASTERGTTFTARGRVRVRRARARRVTVTVAFRGGRTLGTQVLRRLRSGTSRSFAVEALVPARGVDAGTYRVAVCARTGRGKAARCRTRTLQITDPVGVPGVATASPSPGASPTATATATPTAPETPASQGAETLGDRLFPALGNGGYDAEGYDLALTYSPVMKVLSGTAIMTATATQELTRFSLDLQQGLLVSAVTVDGAEADAAQPAGTNKLRVTPATPIAAGSTFTVATTYAGVPPVIIGADGSQEGFVATPDGAFVAGEPMGTQGWFPCNNHPSDKAAFKLAMTVPTGTTIVSNGELRSDTPAGLNHTTVWEETHPMATYLATATLGNFTVAPIRTVDGLDYYDAAQGAPGAGIVQEPDMIALFRGQFGPYPFDIAGSIQDANVPPLVNYALETQTKPIYPSASAASVSTVAHEIAHQWFGDSLSPARWEDIWLNEGFAEFASWRYLESIDDSTTAARYESLYEANGEGDSFWSVPPARPETAADLFDPDAMYDRGAMTLEALRQIVGDEAFYEILSAWASEHSYGNVTTSQFVDLVQAESGKDPARVEAFFQDWLYDTDRPAITPDTF